MKDFRTPSFGLLAAAVGLTLTASAAHAQFSIDPPCIAGADHHGFAVAADGDFDGDGTNDIAIGSPCSSTTDLFNAGRVTVFSGATGKRIFTRKGTEDNQYFGAAVAFLQTDLASNKDKLAIGSPGYDVPSTGVGDDGLNDGGKVDIYIRGGGVRLTFLGEDKVSGVGLSIAGLPDMNGDGDNEIAIGAMGAKNNGSAARSGRISIYNQDTGEMLSEVPGFKNGVRFGDRLVSVGDADGDEIPDLAMSTEEADIDNKNNAGVLQFLAGPDILDVIFEQVGAKKDLLGADLAAAGDRNGDDLGDVVIGAPGVDDNGINGSGAVSIISPTGDILLAVTDDEPQENAAFGSAVTGLPDINGDSIPDLAAGAPQFDALTSTVLPDAGRTVAISGLTGEVLWSVNGDVAGAQSGHTLASGLDYNNDGTDDVVVGAPTDAPTGRRLGGSVKVLSGVDGSLLRLFRARHGLETRIFVYGRGRTRLSGFNVNGVRRELNAPVPGSESGELSVAILDDGANVRPGEVLVAAAKGSGGDDGMVYVYKGHKRNDLTTEFDALPGGVNGGVNIAAGRVGLADEDQDRIVAVQADSTDGDVRVRVFRRLDEGSAFFLENEFLAFTAGEQFTADGFLEPIDILPGGGTVAVGDVIGDDGRQDIIVGTVSGAPVVRVFDINGALQSEWLAYDPVDFAGTNVTVVDGEKRVLTVPVDGQPQIKTFDGSGNRINGGDGEPLLIIPAGFENETSGGKLTTADVDFDDVLEILFMPNSESTVNAVEQDGTEVVGFEAFEASSGPGAAFAGTDSFVRK